MDINKITCDHVLKLEPYQSAKRIGGHGHAFLNANESPKSQLYFFNSTTLNRYPDPQPFEILVAYSDYVNLRPENVLISRGSDEAISLLVRTFCEIDEAICIAPPTYGMYEVVANTNRVNCVIAKRATDYSLNADSILDAINSQDKKVKLVFIDSPANPLGIIFNKDELVKLLKALPDTLIVIDEAYTEFEKGTSYAEMIKEYDNLVVLRTLSKAFALAGIRCGFTLANKDIITMLNKVIDPYAVPDPVAQVAKQALARGGIELMQERVAETIELREKLREALSSLKIVKEIFESHANFLLVRFDNGESVFNALLQKGIVPRAFYTKKTLENCIRITVGTKEELDELMRTLVAYQESL